LGELSLQIRILKPIHLRTAAQDSYIIANYQRATKLLINGTSNSQKMTRKVLKLRSLTHTHTHKNALHIIALLILITETACLA